MGRLRLSRCVDDRPHRGSRISRVGRRRRHLPDGETCIFATFDNAARAAVSIDDMPRLVFTQQLRRFTEVPEIESDAGSLRQALEDAFAVNPQLRGYVLDDQSHLRPHLVVFIDGRRLSDRRMLDVALPSDGTVYVLQALTGG